MSQPPGWATPGPGAPEPPAGAAPGGASPPGAWAPGPPGAPGFAPWAPPAPPRPGVIPLRPLGLGEILDASIAYIRRNPRATLGLAALVAALDGLLNLVVIALGASSITSSLSLDESTLNSANSSSTALDTGLNAASAVQTVLGLVLQILATGALTFVMSQAVLGRSVTARAAWARIRPIIWRLIGVALLTGLIIGGVALACLLPGILALVAGAGPAGGVLLFLGIVVFVPLAVWLYVGLSLASAALVLERLPVVASLRRSWQLVKGAFWRVLGISLLASLLASVIAAIITIPFALVGGLGSLVLGHSAGTSFVVALFGYALGATAASVVTLPFKAGVTSLLYLDRRIRREGLDLELVRAVGGATPAPMPSGPPQPGAPEQRW